MGLFYCNLYSKIYFRLNNSVFKSISRNELPEKFSVTYHTGALKTKQNSIDSINSALAHGAKTVEIDVSFRPDGTPVIIHNDSPKETEGILLEKAFEAVAQSKECMINLDIKSTKNLAAVDELASKYKLTERVFYTGVFENFVNSVQKDSQIPYYLNYNVSENEANSISDLLKIAEKVKNYRAIGINSNYTYANDLFVKTMRENGLLVSLWTVNKTDDMIKILKLKPDNITTKKPHILNNILK